MMNYFGKDEIILMRRRTDGMKNAGCYPQHRKTGNTPGLQGERESVCQILVKMQEQLIFLLAALTAGISCLTALKSTPTGHEPKSCNCAEVSAQPAHIAKGERQAKQQSTPSEGRVPQRLNTDHEDLEEPFDVSSESNTNLRTEEFETMKKHEGEKYDARQRRCDRAQNAKSHINAITEDCKETEENTKQRARIDKGQQRARIDKSEQEPGSTRASKEPGSTSKIINDDVMQGFMRNTPRSGKDVKEDDNEDHENYGGDMMRVQENHTDGKQDMMLELDKLERSVKFKYEEEAAYMEIKSEDKFPNGLAGRKYDANLKGGGPSAVFEDKTNQHNKDFVMKNHNNESTEAFDARCNERFDEATEQRVPQRPQQSTESRRDHSRAQSPAEATAEHSIHEGLEDAFDTKIKIPATDARKTQKQPSDENMMRSHGGGAIDENYVIELNQLNNENVLMAEAMCNDITVNGTVRDHNGSNRGPDLGQACKAKGDKAMEERKFEYSGGEVSRQSSVAEFTIRRSSTRACVEGC